MSAIGSVFLGDVQRLRLRPSSTPPSSPPPVPPSPSMSAMIHPPSPPSLPSSTPISPSPFASKPALVQPPPTIDPALSLELRLRWLEAIILGVRQDAKDRKGKDKVGLESKLKHGETLIRLAEDIQRRLNAVVSTNEGLKRFVEHYDQHAHLLTPAFTLSATVPIAPTYENMAPGELEALLVEMEPDIRAADRDMREIELLEKKGVTGAGKLPDYEALQPRLDKLMRVHEEDLKLAALLEKRISMLMEQHATHVDALSELFVAWDDTLTVAEDKVTRLQREAQERRRLGYE